MSFWKAGRGNLLAGEPEWRAGTQEIPLPGGAGYRILAFLDVHALPFVLLPAGHPSADTAVVADRSATVTIGHWTVATVDARFLTFVGDIAQVVSGWNPVLVVMPVAPCDCPGQ